jgi:vacuolar protein sorting-associated protein 13A/C
MKVQIYSPYIIMNKTGLPFNLAFKTWSGTQNKVAGQEAFATNFKHSNPTPFSERPRELFVNQAPLLKSRVCPVFSFPTEERSNRLLLKVGNSSWSKVSMSR